MYYIITYDKSEVKQQKQIFKTDLENGYQIWLDLENSNLEEISNIREIFAIDANILKQYSNGVKKPQINVLESYIFTILLNTKFENLQTLETEAVYMFFGKNWLITIHSSIINLKEKTQQIFENDKMVLESSIDILYYNILTIIVEEYEQVLTAIEIAMTDLEEKSLYQSSKKILVKLERLSR